MVNYRNVMLIAFTCLSACATPQTVLKNDNGDVVTCGGSSTGSIVGGMIGYSIQKDNDDKCVHNYIEQGYQPIKIGDVKVNQNSDNKSD